VCVGGMIVSMLGLTGAGALVAGLAVAFDEEHGEDDVADTAGQPNGQEEYGDNAGGDGSGELALCVHDHVCGGGPSADEDVGGVGQSGVWYEESEEDAGQGGGVDDVPLFDESEVDAGGVVVLGVVRGMVMGGGFV